MQGAGASNSMQDNVTVCSEVLEAPRADNVYFVHSGAAAATHPACLLHASLEKQAITFMSLQIHMYAKHQQAWLCLPAKKQSEEKLALEPEDIHARSVLLLSVCAELPPFAG